MLADGKIPRVLDRYLLEQEGAEELLTEGQAVQRIHPK
jgi:hypothetical protein